MKKKAVVLLSGGLDSTTCLAVAKSQGYECYALSFDYGQKHRVELEAAKRIAAQFSVKKHEIVDLHFLGALGGSSLTDQTMQIEQYGQHKEAIPSTYVPARNTIMLSIALGWAEIIDADSLFIGVSAIDYSGYPDCRPAYIQAFTEMANLATKKGVSGHPVVIETPLIHLTKAETIQLGLSHGVDYAETLSCYQADREGRACGQCDSCVYRKKGFEEAGAADPTRYA